MKLLFWICFAIIFYTYIGYFLLLKLQVRLNGLPFLQRASFPKISIIIAARNEEANLPAKLQNIQTSNYPQDRIQVVIVSDGSTDRTAEILLAASANISPIIIERSQGKAVALNEAVKIATGDLLVFQDARQAVEPNAVSALIACFADPNVGAVSGELVLETDPTGNSSDAVGIYWKIEKLIRKLESASGSVVGVTGAIYAVRRELYTEIPQGTILDDVFIPMHVARKGKRVVFQPAAIARDRIFSKKGKEFSRKVRTLTGNYQLMSFAPWILSPANPLLFRFISHKLLRLLIPLLLALLLISSFFAAGTIYRLTYFSQLVFYILAIIGSTTLSASRFKPAAIASTFVILNTAAVIAFYNFVVGRKRVWN